MLRGTFMKNTFLQSILVTSKHSKLGQCLGHYVLIMDNLIL